MLRRVAPRALVASSAALPLVAMRNCGYRTGPFQNPVRRPQLTEEQRAKVVVNQAEWPEEFKDYDPQDPYKNTPEWLPLSAFNLWLFGCEVAFITVFYELVFPHSI